MYENESKSYKTNILIAMDFTFIIKIFLFTMNLQVMVKSHIYS